VLGSRKPNCVIVDEIDGATGGAEGTGAISALLKIINATGGGSGRRAVGGGAAEEDEEEEAVAGGDLAAEGGGGRGVKPRRRPPPGGTGTALNKGRNGAAAGSKGRLPPLSRPVICIANDLYAPVLRPLRDVAQIFHFRVRMVFLQRGLASRRCPALQVFMLGSLAHSGHACVGRSCHAKGQVGAACCGKASSDSTLVALP
jgi:hypothetical protein